MVVYHSVRLVKNTRLVKNMFVYYLDKTVDNMLVYRFDTVVHMDHNILDEIFASPFVIDISSDISHCSYYE
jgi:hypothetical protein